MLTHLVDLDSDAHDRGPFEAEANATLERTDELIGQILKVLPKGYDFALVSDHGFERVDAIANLKTIAAAQGVTGDLKPMGGLVVTSDPKMADWLRSQSGKGDVGREVPHDELAKYAPGLGDATAFEPAPHVMFGRSERDVPRMPPPEKGDHGFWPLRSDYRSVFLLSGPGIHPARLGPLEMTALKDRLAGAMDLACPGP
jgi:predicted AlkP superfamily pyrophosphatase or phosphodiesterase